MRRYKVNANIPINKINGPTLLKKIEKKPVVSGFGRFIILLIKNPIIRITPVDINV